MQIQLPVIGRKDKVDIPAFGLENVSVKIDSGAYSCSIHCESVQENMGRLEVIFLDDSLPKYNGKVYYFDHFSRKTVKSSTGEKQLRYFIHCEIILFGKNYPADFSLTQRSGLKNPILIGRKILNKQFLIDTSKVNLSYRSKIKK